MRTHNLFLFAFGFLASTFTVIGQTTVSNTLPLVTIRGATNAPISESGATNALIVARETTNVTSSLTVSYSIGGGASNGVDYVEIPSTVTIPSGFHNVRVPLTAINDTVPEPTENIVVTLRPSEFYRTNIANKVAVSVIDNDNLVPSVRLFSPTNNTVFVGPTNILLKAEASDPDGWLRRVEFYRNGVLMGNVTNHSTNVYQFLWTNAQPGNYSLVAKAVDNLEARESSAPVSVVVQGTPPSTNLPPTARILSPTNNAVFVAPAEILISASASDTDGSVRTLQFLAGTNVLATVTNSPGSVSDSFHFTWRNVAAGEYALRVRATDNGGAIRLSEPVVINVNPPETNPTFVSIFSPDREAAEAPTLAGTNVAVFTITRQGNTNINLTVYYRIGGTASNGVDYASIPTKTIIPAGKLSTNIIIRGFDDLLPEEHESVVIALEAPICAAVFPPPPGCYTIGESGFASAVIVDNDQVTNSPPVVRLVSPTNNAAFIGPIDIPVAAEASDADGEITRVDFYVGDRLLGSRTTPPYSLTWSNVQPGIYSVTAKAIDDRGAFRFAEPSKITVRSLAETAFVYRSMPLWYVPGVKARVQLRAEPRTNTTNYVVIETPPAGWTIQTIGEHGTVQAGQIKFGPFKDALRRTFVYEVVPPANESGEKRFNGEATWNDISTTVLGARVIAPVPPHPADLSSLWTLSDAEVAAYNKAWSFCQRWMNGPNPIPVNYLTRAGFILEDRYYTASRTSPTPIPPMIWVPISPELEAVAPGEPWGSNRLATAIASMPTNYAVGAPFTVTIAVTPTAAVKAYALEEMVPHGFTVTNVTGEGVFCRETRKIRWGLFNSAEPLTLSYQLVGTTNAPSVAKFGGVISCNGINQPITGRRETRRGGIIGTARLDGISPLSDGNRLLTFTGEPGVTYVLEGSSDLVDWTPLAELLNNDGTLQYIDLSSEESNKFYRAVPRE